jgi:hypothetical protein
MLRTAILLLPLLLFVLLTASPAEAGGYQKQIGGYTYDYNHNDTIIAIPVNGDYYYSVGQDIEELTRKISDEIIRRFDEKFAVQNTQPAAEPAKKLSRDMFRLAGGPAPADDLNDRVFALFNSSCIKCHKPGASRPGNIVLFTPDRKLFIDPDPQKESLRRRLVYEAIDSGNMPKGVGPFPAADKALVRQWMEKVSR